MRLVICLLFAAATSLVVNVADAFQPPASITGHSISVPRTADRRQQVTPCLSPASPRLSMTQLEAVNPLVTSLASPAGAIAVLAFVVLVHESGHYLAARTFGIKVEEFSIGIGPKILGFQALGNDFSLRAFPLGGYVRFPENYNQTLARIADDLNMLQDARKAPEWQRKLTNFVSLGSYNEQVENLESALAQDEQKNLPLWTKLFSGSKSTTPKQATLQEEPYEIEYYDDPDLLQNRPWPERAVVISGGVIFNIILAFIIYFGEISGGGLTKPVFDAGAKVNVMPISTAASSGKLSQGDVIMAVNGSPLSNVASPSAANSQKAIGEFIATIRATPEGESLKLSVLQAGSKTAKDVSIQPKNNGQTQSIGAMLGPNFSMSTIKSSSPAEAAKLATAAVKDITSETFTGISQFASTAFKSKAAGGGGAQLSGPIGLIRTGSEVVSSSDFATVAVFAAAISINLAVVNALPLPALDGGQMVFILVEALMGKKVNQQVQENITGVAVLVLFVLSLSTTVGDVQNLFTK
jgi:membrane-associated protease RseP (regulator of RpoE activity)